VTIAPNAWVCVEWEYDDTTSLQTLWLDGVQKVSGKAALPSKVVAMAQIGIGW